MAKEATFTREGVVHEILPQSRFRVDLDEGARVLAQLSTRARRAARPLPGDRVMLEMTHYDEERGRILEVLR
jgi:translation initiation factor IF-1